jgi:multiple sugar transport system permease protein
MGKMTGSGTARSFILVLKQVGLYGLLVGWTLIYVAPFLWTLLTAVMPDKQIYAFPPEWLPKAVVISNFSKAIAAANFGRYFLNSAIVTTTTTVLNLFLSSLTGYTLARLKFPGRRFFFLLILGTLMVPGQVTMIAVYIIMKNMPLFGGNNLLGQGGTGWLNSYPALIIPGVASAFGIFLMRQFMEDLPQELEDAARVDGCSEFGIFWRVMLPQCAPALTALAIFTFMASWNDFLWPLIVTNTDEMKTVQLGLSVFRGYFHTQWNLMMAATFLISLPPIIVFLLGQRHFVRGIVFSGLKG